MELARYKTRNCTSLKRRTVQGRHIGNSGHTCSFTVRFFNCEFNISYIYIYRNLISINFELWYVFTRLGFGFLQDDNTKLLDSTTQDSSLKGGFGI